MSAVILGTVSTVLYALMALGQEYRPDLGDAVGLFLSWFAAMTGVRLCVVSFGAENLGILSAVTDRAYVFLAGGVLIWAGLAGVGRTFKRVMPANVPGATDQDEVEKQDGQG